jgi:biotin carboxyl carrier protein
MKYTINIHQNLYEVEIAEIIGGVAQVFVNGESFRVHLEKQTGSSVQTAAAPVQKTKAPQVTTAPATSPTIATETIKAPIPGMIIDISVNVGDSVKHGQVLIVLEAMKMENNIIASVNGVVKEIRVSKGSQVATGDVLVVIG